MNKNINEHNTTNKDRKNTAKNTLQSNLKSANIKGKSDNFNLLDNESSAKACLIEPSISKNVENNANENRTISYSTQNKNDKMHFVQFLTMDGNTACARVAYKVSDCAPIYPITPSSTMAELCDTWANSGEKNIFGEIVRVYEMQSEAGVAGALHGNLRGGALSTTFTASQGLLLMIPDMYKIAGEQLPCVIHVSARALATHALSIFGDHSDVMATRATGFAMLCSASVQQAQDFTLVAHSATLRASLPFLHFFDGFRTSHEVNEIEALTDEDIKSMIDFNKINQFKLKALSNSDPKMYGTSQSADVYFANRERCNTLYDNTAQIVEDEFERLYEISGREYHIFDYYGADDAEYVTVCMGSGTEVLEQTAKQLNQMGYKVGVLCVRLYRPFDAQYFISKLPNTVKRIAVLDRTKEAGAIGEPLFTDVCTVIMQYEQKIKVIGGRYGLGSFEFNPAMAKAVFDNLMSDCPKNHFTVGIVDDVTKLSLNVDYSFKIDGGMRECVFFGIGGDGTISANKNSAKIIGSTGLHSQAYFVYDSKKSGSMTVSHLRFGGKPISAPYQIDNAEFVAIHNFSFVAKVDVLQYLANNGTVLLNCPFEISELNNFLPDYFVSSLKEKNAKLYIVDALVGAKKLGLKNKINIIMQSAFFKLTNIMPFDKAKEKMADFIKKSYSKFGENIVDANIQAIDFGAENLIEVDYSTLVGTKNTEKEKVSNTFYEEILQPIAKLQGQKIPVSKFSMDGSIPIATSQYEKRGIATDLPRWNKENCIQCNLCSVVCPHACIRAKETFDDMGAESKDNIIPNRGKFCLAVSPLDCTGCGNCACVCPAKNKALVMENAEETIEYTLDNYAKFEKIEKLPNQNKMTLKGSQFEQPLLEFSGACAGCGQTAYIKLLTQICGESMLIANATGCSSIWGGSYPSCPYSKSNDGLGVAWANSLFEDNAEFGLGIWTAYEIRHEQVRTLLCELSANDQKFSDIFTSFVMNEKDFNECKKIFFDLQKLCSERLNFYEKYLKLSDKEINVTAWNTIAKIKQLQSIFDAIMPKNVWIIGGDGWAYDIGFGGLDHVLASNKNVNILVLDTEVYSNTGGQASKSTPYGAVAKFAQGGKTTQKKDLAGIAMQYDNVYVAKVCIGANPNQALTAFKEAMAHDGPSIVIAYAPCVAQGIDMSKTPNIEKLAVSSGYFTLMRRIPHPELSEIALAENNLKKNCTTNNKGCCDNTTINPNVEHLERIKCKYSGISGEFIVDSPTPTTSLEEFLSLQNRFPKK